jgi:hypothetical protein
MLATLLKFSLQNVWICIAICAVYSKHELEAKQDKITAAVDSVNVCCDRVVTVLTL